MATSPEPTFGRSEHDATPAQARSSSRRQDVYEMSVEDCRKLDQLAVSEFQIPSILLMENAAIALKGHALNMIPEFDLGPIQIFCGPGNNAGDGFALARHLANQNLHPTLILTNEFEQYQGDAKINLDIICKMGLQIVNAEIFLSDHSSSPTLIVDALFGTGLTRKIEGASRLLIDQINQHNPSITSVLSVDVPSGLNAQNGHPIGQAVVKADRTVTFAALKDGFRSIDAQTYLGEVHVADIGIPQTLLRSLGRKVNHTFDRL